MKMLYNNLIKEIQVKSRHENYHSILTFSASLNDLKTKIIKLSKHEISLMNLFQNSSNVLVEKYSA